MDCSKYEHCTDPCYICQCTDPCYITGPSWVLVPELDACCEDVCRYGSLGMRDVWLVKMQPVVLCVRGSMNLGLALALDDSQRLTTL